MSSEREMRNGVASTRTSQFREECSKNVSCP